MLGSTNAEPRTSVSGDREVLNQEVLRHRLNQGCNSISLIQFSHQRQFQYGIIIAQGSLLGGRALSLDKDKSVSL